MAKIITAKEAAELFQDNITVATAVTGLAGWPQEIASAVEARYLETGHPNHLRHIHASGCGNWKDGGENCWVHGDLMTENICSHQGSTPALIEAIVNNEIMAWNLPLGTILQMFKETGRSGPGVLSRIGLGTFVDPRFDGGKLNPLTKEKGEDLVEYIPDFLGEEYLLYKPMKMDLAMLRGTTADENGNITIEHEAFNLESLAVAQAVKACGGTVMVQVETLAKAGSLNPRLVKVPGIYVDYIIICEHPEMVMQTHETKGNRSFTGEVRVPVNNSSKPLPLSDKKVILRRVAEELKPGLTVNLGLGLPVQLGDVLTEEGCPDLFVTLAETGNIGGVAGGAGNFGAQWNVEASYDQGDHFNFYEGGGLDVAVFGLSEVDKDGNINITKLNGKIMGLGGFANIAATAKHSYFIGNFTAGGIKNHIENGKLVIDQEGKFKKFVKECEQLALIADEVIKHGNKMTFITERCVLERTKEGLVLTEIAPGIDLQTQILDQMNFAPIIPKNGPKQMDPAIFEENWGKLKEIITN